MTYLHVVGKALSWPDTTLCHTDRSIHRCGSILVDPMEMQAGGLVAQLVLNIDNKPITFDDIDMRNRPLVVDAYDRARERIIGISCNPCYVEIVCDSRRLHECAAGSDRQKK